MATPTLPWWRGCVIYQVYPRSFADSNHDGIGDLPGLIARLDHIAELGVEAIWISPVLRSPMKDFGYDISDYRAIDPVFGTTADFHRLIEAARRRGLAVILDLAFNHTSDQHPWFRESRRSRTADTADWYVWAEPRPDGTPPNNWLSVFGGSAWQWDARREQYYLHNFLPAQPDLNFHHPAVVEQLLDTMKHWLDHGVGGFRLDAINFYLHDRALRDNPPRQDRSAQHDVLPSCNPYTYQQHLYDKSQPENVALLRRIRELMNRYPGAIALGEISDDNAASLLSAYTAGVDKLQLAYTFDLSIAAFDATAIRAAVERIEAVIGDGWPCWSLGNHDICRVVTRWGGEHAGPALAKLAMALLLSLRGSVCIYQGEELGLPEAVVPYERLRDPYGIEMWPAFKGRDGCRTPMPWSEAHPHSEFSMVEPWLPVPAEHRALAVATQAGDPASTLSAYRRFLRWRRDHPVLRDGALRFHEVPPPALVIERSSASERLVIALNLGPAALTLDVSSVAAAAAWQPLDGHGFDGAKLAGTFLTLPGFGAWFAAVPAQGE
jgi:alpha-glucosidase